MTEDPQSRRLRCRRRVVDVTRHGEERHDGRFGAMGPRDNRT